MKYPKYYEYENLYKRFFKRNPEELVKIGEVKINDKVLDMCAGGGRLTKALRKVSNNVTYLDGEKDMIPNDLNDDIKIINMKVEEFLNNNNERYDKIFCQQAVNYWLLRINIKSLANIINKNGIFVFNTFGYMPSESLMTKSYKIEEKEYLEVSYLLKTNEKDFYNKNIDKIMHVQVVNDSVPHVTAFDYISEERFLEILNDDFDVEIIKDGKTSIYKCTKK